MKSTLSIIIALFFVSTLFSQHVGINKSSPEHTLDVRSLNNPDPAGLNISNQDKTKFVRFFSGSEAYPDPSMTWAPNYNMLFATYNDNTLAFTEYMRISTLGNIGIGVSDPQAKLDIQGGNWNLDGGSPGDFRVGNDIYNLRIGVATGGGGTGIARIYSHQNSLILGTNSRPALTIGKNENVGIGTINPTARLEIQSAGLADTMILLKNTNASGPIDYGLYFKDENASPTIGAYISADNEALIAENFNTNSPVIDAYNHNSTGATYGIIAGVESPSGIGIKGSGQRTGVYGLSSLLSTGGVGVKGRADSQFGRGVEGNSDGESGIGLYGISEGVYGKGLYAAITSNNANATAIIGVSGSGSSYAARFEGNVEILGVLAKSAGSFKIDHPMDPENKYLSHSFVESPDMMNIYNGNIITDKLGNAKVTLPDYFEVLNMDYRYQLTVMGEFAQAIISEKIDGNAFTIKTDKPNIEVSWQVTGVRNDAFARKNRIPEEEDKEVENRGKYLNPEAFDQDRSKGIRRLKNVSEY